MIVQISCAHIQMTELYAKCMILCVCVCACVIQSECANRFWFRITASHFILSSREKKNTKIISVSMRVDCVFVCAFNRRNHQKKNVWKKPMEYARKSKLVITLALAHSHSHIQCLCCSKWLIVEQFGPLSIFVVLVDGNTQMHGE